MTTAFLIIFSLLIEYIYDPISNMKDTHVMQSLIENTKNILKTILIINMLYIFSLLFWYLF